MNRWLIFAFAFAACSTETSSSGPTVTVLRQTQDPTCFDLVAGPTPADNIGPQLCADTPTTKLIAGTDLVALVIDYGKLDIPQAATIPAPTVNMSIDGAPVTLSANTVLQPRSADHTYYLAYFSAPATVSNSVQLSVSVATGFASNVPTALQTVAPDVKVSVLEKTDTGCFTTIAGSSLDSALGLTNICATATTATLHAAVDAVEVVMDYGTPDISATTRISPPLLDLTADGVPQTGSITAGPAEQSMNGRRFFTASLHAPPQPSNDVRIAVRSAPNAVPNEVHLTSSAAAPTITLAECASNCTATGAVGTVHATLSVPGDVSQTVALHSLIDGAFIGDPVSPVTTALVGGKTQAAVTVRVPDGVRDGAVWTLQAQLGAIVASLDVTLHKPVLSASLSCPAPYTLGTGSSVGMTVVAPLDIHTRQAIYTMSLDGVPQGPQSTLDLVTADNDAKTIAGTIALTAPSKTGTWTINVSVDGYSVQTIVATIVP